MSANVGRCPLCGGEKQPSTTTFAVDLKFGVVLPPPMASPSTSSHSSPKVARTLNSARFLRDGRQFSSVACVPAYQWGLLGQTLRRITSSKLAFPVVRGGNLTDGFVDEGFVFISEEKADQLRNANARSDRHCHHAPWDLLVRWA